MMSHRLRLFLLFLFVASALAQTFQYSRGWTNGRKRSSPQLIVPRPGLVTPIDFNSWMMASPEDGRSSVKITDQVSDEVLDRCIQMAMAKSPAGNKESIAAAQ